MKMKHIRSNTPLIPSFILDFKGIEVIKSEAQVVSRWINAFNDEYLGGAAKNLYATETLFGDWNGEILILAQDALPASALKKIIQSHIEKGEPKEFAWRHANKEIHGDKKGWKTNESLRRLVTKYANGVGILYGSAAAHMLYDDGSDNYRQVLRGFKDPQLMKHLTDVLSWVVGNMPNLKYIVCLGEKAWQVVNSSANTQYINNFKYMREMKKHVFTSIANKQLTIIPTYHPMARASTAELESDWKVLYKLLEKNA